MLDNNNKIDNEERIDANKVEQVQQGNQANVAEKEKGRGTFYGIIAFAVFIIMAVGATFAYFTASTSSVSGSVKTGSTTLELDYISYENAWISEKLIPVYTNVVEYSVERRPDETAQKPMCIDDFGNEICSIYVFQVRNNAASPQNVSIYLKSEENEFQNLRAMLYRVYNGENYDPDTPAPSYSPDPVFASSADAADNSGESCISKGTCIQVVNGGGEALFAEDDSYYSSSSSTQGFNAVYVNRLNVVKELQYVTTTETTGEEGNQTTTTSRTPSIAVKVPAVGDPEVKLSDAIPIHGLGGSETIYNNYETFMIVLYIWDNKEDQNISDGQNNKFVGTVLVKGADGGDGVTGTIGGVNKDDYTGLQSNTTTNTSSGTTEQGGGDTTGGTTEEP